MRRALARGKWLQPQDRCAADGALMIEQIKRPLAEDFLFGKLAAGGTVKIGVSADGNSLKLETLAIETPALPATLQ